MKHGQGTSPSDHRAPFPIADPARIQIPCDIPELITLRPAWTNQF